MNKKDTSKVGSAKSTSLKSSSKLSQTFNDLKSAINITYSDYLKSLTPRLKLIDIFLTFLVALGVLQFSYVLLIGNFPFNAFLGGFISCVGQFVLTVSLRLQINAENYDSEAKEVNELDNSAEEVETKTGIISEKPFKFITPERSFGDYVFASLILHFIVYHFIN